MKFQLIKITRMLNKEVSCLIHSGGAFILLIDVKMQLLAININEQNKFPPKENACLGKSN